MNENTQPQPKPMPQQQTPQPELPEPRRLNGRETLSPDGKKVTRTRIPLSHGVVVDPDGKIVSIVGGGIAGGSPVGGHIISTPQDRVKLMDYYIAQAHARSKTILPNSVGKSQDRIRRANFIRSLAKPIPMPPEIRRMHEQNGDSLPDPNVPVVVVGQPNGK